MKRGSVDVSVCLASSSSKALYFRTERRDVGKSLEYKIIILLSYFVEKGQTSEEVQKSILRAAVIKKYFFFLFSQGVTSFLESFCLFCPNLQGQPRIGIMLIFLSTFFFNLWLFCVLPCEYFSKLDTYVCYDYLVQLIEHLIL